MVNKDFEEEIEMGKKKNRQQRRPHRQQRRKNNKVKSTQAIPSQLLPQTQIQIWTNTHRQLVEWHRQQTLRLCGINETETEEANHLEKRSPNCLDYVWESSSEEDEAVHGKDEEEFVDENYLKFLEITIRHQEDLKRRRERVEDAPTPTAALTTPTATLN